MVAVSVTISVTVAVAVAIVTVFAHCAVEYQRHVLELLVFVDLFEFGKHVSFKQSGADHEYSPVGILFDDLGICNDLDGRTVNDYVVVIGFQHFNEFSESAVFKKLGWIGRNCTYRNKLQVGAIAVGDDSFIDVGNFSAEVVGQTYFRIAYER